MKKITILVALFLIGMSAIASDLFKAPLGIALRAPAVPLVTSDPYLSIWSPYNELTEGNTQHWTGVEHPLVGAIRVDGKTYRFMGKDKPNLPILLPMSYSEQWLANYTFKEPIGDWTNLDYDDSTWKQGKGAFGTDGMARRNTKWDTENIWIRRVFELNENVERENVVLQYSHDDIFELFLNGEKLVSTDYVWKDNVFLELTKETKKKLKQGQNIIAVHCQNKAGGGYVDFGLFKKIDHAHKLGEEAIQKSVDVLPTQTYYTFECGKVELDVVFTAPLLPDDLDLISTPINYISYRVRSLDNKKHDVQIYIETTPELAVNEISQPVMFDKIDKNGFTYLKTGTIDQPYTKRVGDGVRIDWGYAYLASEQTANKVLGLGEYFAMKEEFFKTGKLLSNATSHDFDKHMYNSMTVLAYSEDLGSIDKNGKSSFMMVGYDDVYSIEYFYKRYKAYWTHDGQVSISDAFERASRDYKAIMERTRAFDKQLMADAERAGGKNYAELCALVYRQTLAAHKLIKDDEGNLLFLSKENHSNGCINTVDITYPSSPLFLIYNTELLKGMMTPIFHYSESGRWNKPYPAHDLGTYPIANGQLYGEDMPVEEAGNMILVATAVSKMDGNADYAAKHWKTLTIWANYLSEVGLDPDNQLCTDDFAGHLAHNANLSVKAIMAIAGYGEMAKMLGKNDIATHYINRAKQMAIEWEEMALTEDHYKLAFDREDTWSQKYNLVWDKVFDLDIFPKSVIEKEIPFYLKQINKYGMPLDSRRTYTKSDWVMWSATLSDDLNVFQTIINPIYKYANETESRVPISDWHDTHDGKMQNFKARSVVGGYYMKMLEYVIKHR